MVRVRGGGGAGEVPRSATDHPWPLYQTAFAALTCSCHYCSFITVMLCKLL